MPNTTRSDILNQVYEYLPTANVSSHDTLIDNLIDLAAEEISYAHNFRYLASSTPVEATLVADAYYLDESDFSFSNLKEPLHVMWLNSTTGEHREIRWKPQQTFHRDHPYRDYSSISTGKPKWYTRVGTRWFFNVPADESITVRVWYQQTHGNFSSDATSHSFVPDNTGFQAIVASVLEELHDALPGMEMSPKAIAAINKKGYWIQKLIDADMKRANEDVEMLENVHGDKSADITDPYAWV